MRGSPETTVGEKKLPSRVRRRPPVSSRPPAWIAASTCFCRSSAICDGRQRSNLRRLAHRIADNLRGHALHEALLELAVYRLVHDEALGGDAALAVVDAARLHCVLDRFRQIGRRHHNERVAAAQLKHALLDQVAGLRRNSAARSL